MPFRKFDFGGSPVWARDVDDHGLCFLYGFSVSAHGGRVSMIGQADKGFYEDPTSCTQTGVVIGWLRTFTADGDLVWQRAVEAGPVGGEQPFTGGKVVLATASGVYVASNTTTTFAGFVPRAPRPDYSQCPGLGDTFFDALDAYVRRYDDDGNVVWTHQFGSTVFDLVIGLGIGPGGAVYTAGDTSCTMEGQPYHGGVRDAFLARFTVDPQTAAGRTHLIVGTIETLKDAGRLARPDFDALVRPLAQAAQSIVAHNTVAARRALEAFLRALNRAHARGALTDDEAAGLAAAAQAVLEML